MNEETTRQEPPTSRELDACARGPHPIPLSRQVSCELHRLYSVKAGARITLCGSALEADAVFWAEGDPDIVAICVRALRIRGPFGTRADAILELGATRRSGVETFYAVRREATLETAEDGRRLPPHWAAIESRCQQSGHRCAVLTDLELARYRQRIANWRLLLPFVRDAHERQEPSATENVIEVFESHENLTLDELPRHLTSDVAQAAVPTVARLLHEGTLAAELEQCPFTSRTPIRLTESARHA